jgi:CubicO group peptidase (beta-lactamase class C family)
MSRSAARTTVRQLLTMTGGWTAFYDADTARPQLRRVLAAGPEVDPGGFVYSNVGPHLLSAVLARATGLSTLAYARRELFDPLGINSQPAFEGPMAQRDNPDVVSTNSFRWLRDPDGVHAGSYGLALTARDMIKIGELWLNGGVWHGRRILTPTTSPRPPAIRSASSKARSEATAISGGSHRWRRTAPTAHRVGTGS